MFGFIQGYFSLPQGYPYQWGGYVYYPAPYIPPHPPMYSYPESCCCFVYEIETGFPEISNQEISGNGDIMPEIVDQITLKADHSTTSTTIGQLTEGLRAETKPGVSEEESSRFLQQTIIQSTTELIIEPKTVSIYGISAELSTTTSESIYQSITELSTQSIAETNTELIIESSTVAPEETESTTESKKLITETTIIKMTEYTERSTTESTTHESVSSTETAHLPETADESTAKSSESTAGSTDKSTKEATESTAGSTDKSTKEATESTTQTTVDFKKETPAATTVSTTDSIPKEENQYNVEEGITVSTIRTTEGDMMLNTVTGKEYLLGRTTEVSAESSGENYQHLNTASNSELTTENNKVLRSGFITQIFSDNIYDEISQTEDYSFPYLDAA
jgi:hypothetical protein